MADQTNIEWCDSTFNPWTGCTKVSPACDHCYAEAWSKRASDRVGKWGPGAPRVRTTPANWRKPVQWNAKPFYECAACDWRGDDPIDATEHVGAHLCPMCHGETNEARRRVFCASLGDVFDNEVDPAWRADLFALIGATPNLDWLLLTKRIGNAANMMFLARGGHLPLLPNLWLGATICNQAEADRDIPKLLAVPAAVRFLSIEPMLGPVDLGLCDCDHGSIPAPHNIGGVTCPKCNGTGGSMVDWVIVGGESGPKARPMHPDWVRSVRNQCEAAGVPFLFKQWGEWADARVDPDAKVLDSHRWPIYPGEPPHGVWSYRVGKAAAGRQLDGRTHDEFPEVRS